MKKYSHLRAVKKIRPKFGIKKNDLIEVNTGEEKGRRGRVLEIVSEKSQALVEGLKLMKKHQRARSQKQPAGIISVPSPIHISNLVLICSKCGKKTRIKWQKIEKKRARICRECGEIIE